MRASKFYWLLALGSLALLTRCTPSTLVQVTNQGPAQGSTYSILYVAPEGVDLKPRIDSLLQEMDQQMSLWVAGSDISRLNNGDSLVLKPEFLEVLKRSKAISKLSHGRFDITIAPLIKAWGFSGGAHAEDVPVDSLMQYIGFEKLQLPKEASTPFALPVGFQIDVNAVAQGYTVDRIARMLEEAGIVRYMVEVGGEVRCKGETIEGRKWRIGIEEPREERAQGQFQTIVVLDSMALATSGNYRKFWINEKGQRVVHTIDPQTGQPVVSNLLSASIIAKNATLADALATAAMVGGLEFKNFIEHLEGVEGYFIVGNKLGDYEIVTTSGWKAYELE